MVANIDSINDKVYMEFYDVLNESFDFKTSNAANDMKNLKLLALHVFDVKDFAFSAGSADAYESSKCVGHRVLLPIETSGNVAQFTFNARFAATVEPVFINKPLLNKEAYLLFLKMIQSCKEVMHHRKELDQMHFVADVYNNT
jgi:hypothetical protein